MYDYDIKDKTYTGTKKRKFPYFSVSLIVIGAGLLIGGGIWYGNTDMSKYNKNIIKSVDEVIDGSKTDRIDIDISAGEVNVGVSDDGQVHLTGNVSSKYVLKENGGTLRVDISPDFDWSFFDMENDDISVEILLPDKEYDDLELEIGAGEVTINDLRLKKCSLDGGAGEITLNNVSCKSTMKAETGAGELDISNSVAGGLDFDIGAGEITYEGEVNGDIKVDCGVGSCDITLSNDRAEYDKKYKISTDAGIGEVNVTFANE